jgi:hypothetical protein
VGDSVGLLDVSQWNQHARDISRPGARDDPTRPPEIYDQVAQYLIECGIQASA